MKTRCFFCPSRRDCSRVNTLGELRPGERATVVRVEGTGALKRRIMDMGVTRGVSLEVCRVAPLGDPIEIKVRGYSLSLRRDDARRIIVA